LSVQPQIEVMSGADSRRVSLEADRTTVGKAAENDVALDDDPMASHLHAVLEHFPAGWCVTDLGSSNGTWVNGERIWAAHRLRHGDEIRVGQTRLIFRDQLSAGGAQTEAEDAPPTLTTRERDVLVALCRPLLDRDMFTEPASTRAIADELVITQAAVKQHLGNLYDKFGTPAGDSHRRARLANEALRRGAVSLMQLRESESGEA
jgi:pSer/pThr/pTyr-binding forkhead associated (FHA) protein